MNFEQIGFICFAHYVPGKEHIHFNRTVILPEYQGCGLGGVLINETCEIMRKTHKIIMGKFSNEAVAKMLIKSKKWAIEKISKNLSKSNKIVGNNVSKDRQKTLRYATKSYIMRYHG